MKRSQRPFLTIAVLLIIAFIVTACAKSGEATPEFTEPETYPETTYTASALEACETAMAALKSREAVALLSTQTAEDGSVLTTRTYLCGEDFLAEITDGDMPLTAQVRYQGACGLGASVKDLTHWDSDFYPRTLDRYDPADKDITLPYGDKIENGSFTFHAIWRTEDLGSWEGDITYRFTAEGEVSAMLFDGTRTTDGEAERLSFETHVPEDSPASVRETIRLAGEGILTPEERQTRYVESKLSQGHPSNATEYDKSVSLGHEEMGWYFGGDMRIRLGAADHSPTGASLTYTALDGLSSLEAGGAYFLETWDGGKWVDVPRSGNAPEDKVLPIFASASSGASHTLELSWADTYGPLASGEYRVGMYHTAKLSDGSEDTQICYAKFRVYGENDTALLTACSDALRAVAESSSYHIRNTDWCLPEKDRQEEPYYYVMQVWHDGQDFLETIDYLSYADGHSVGSQTSLLRSGQQRYHHVTLDGIDEGWETVDYLDREHFAMWAFALEPIDAIVDRVERDGDAIVITQRVDGVWAEKLAGTELRYEFTPQGTLSAIIRTEIGQDGARAESERLEVLDTAPADISAAISQAD